MATLAHPKDVQPTRPRQAKPPTPWPTLCQRYGLRYAYPLDILHAKRPRSGNMIEKECVPAIVICPVIGKMSWEGYSEFNNPLDQIAWTWFYMVWNLQ